MMDNDRLTELRKQYPEIWKVMEIIKDLDRQPGQYWDTMWEREITTILKIAEKFNITSICPSCGRPKESPKMSCHHQFHTV